MSLHRVCCCGSTSCGCCTTPPTTTARIVISGWTPKACTISYRPIPPLNPRYQGVRGDWNGTWDLVSTSNSCVFSLNPSGITAVSLNGDTCDLYDHEPIELNGEFEDAQPIYLYLCLADSGSYYMAIGASGASRSTLNGFLSVPTPIPCADGFVIPLIGSDLSDAGGTATVSFI